MARVAQQTRAFSQMPVVLYTQMNKPTGKVPYEIESGLPLTNAIIEKRNEEYKKFNEECERQHEEMVANLTYTIRSSGGLDGWLVEEETSLVKTFEFSSYEQANQFMHEAGIVCEEMNHHPEWWTTEGGKVVNTRLTTHDAGNKITVNDYKAAKAMNVVESEVKSNIVFKLIKKVLPF